MKVLHLTLHKKWFDEILAERKNVEYRDMTEYWKRRLENKKYDYIHFVNGYGKKRPWMDVEIKSIVKDYETKEYHIHLGKILETGNIK